jgi:hypothetical protein
MAYPLRMDEELDMRMWAQIAQLEMMVAWAVLHTRARGEHTLANVPPEWGWPRIEPGSAKE